MKNYSNLIKQLYKNRKLYELSMSKEKRKNVKRFLQVGNFKEYLKEIQIIIDKIKIESKKLNYNDIKYNKKDNINIHYNTELNALLHTLGDVLFGAYDEEEIVNKIFQDGYQDLFLEMEIHKNNLNKIDVLNGLPNFMKNIGLGKKIYKKLIKDFNYISSFYGYKPSIDSDMTWDSILDDNEIYSFINDNNIISFWNETDYKIIMKKLKEFYKIQGQMFFDDDFLIKYNLTDEKLKNIII